MYFPQSFRKLFHLVFLFIIFPYSNSQQGLNLQPFLAALGDGQISRWANLATGLASSVAGGGRGNFGSFTDSSSASSLTSSARFEQNEESSNSGFIPRSNSNLFGLLPISSGQSSNPGLLELISGSNFKRFSDPAPRNYPPIERQSFDIASLANNFGSLLNPDANNEASLRKFDPLPTLKDLLPGSANNFGIPKGQGCVPLLGDVIPLLYGNCQHKADTQTWQVWGTQINNVLVGGPVDLAKAARATCKLGAERQLCKTLGRDIARCDIIGSLQTAAELQRQTSRCEQLSTLASPPTQRQGGLGLLHSINSLIGGEMAGGLIRNFLG